MPEVAAVKRSLSHVELYQVLHQAQVELYGHASDPALAWVWSVAALETGGGRAAWCWNLGNIKCGPSCRDKQAYCRIPAPPPEYPYQIAYAGPVAAARSLWRLLATPRFAGALSLAKKGVHREATAELGRSGYYTAPIKPYQAIVQRWLVTYRRKFGEPNHVVPSALVIAALPLVVGFWAL